MVFSSAVFLFAFLPIVFILHTAIRNTTVRNILLIVASLLFYAWGEPAYILLLLLSILVNFVLGRFVWGRKPVLAAGVRCQNSSDRGHGQQGGIPMDKMPEYVQDVLDLIEWANGDAKTTKWGSLRAEQGRTAPFNLK